MIEKHEPRPAWVVDAIRDLTTMTEQIASIQDRAGRLMVALAVHGATGSFDAVEPLSDAHHDLEHAFSHITSVRRGIRMAWPNERGDA